MEHDVYDDVHYKLNIIHSGGYSNDFSYDGNATFAMSPKQALGSHGNSINM